MRNFIISTDSTVDLPERYLEENNIAIHPCHYILDGIEYGTDLSEIPAKDFYDQMKNGKMPTTSASNPGYITELMKKQVMRGDDVLHISFSSALSSSYNNACLCALNVMEEIPDSSIVVVDSLSATAGQALAVYNAVEMRKKGKSIGEISKWLIENRLHIVHQFIVKDLFHLVRGGRLSKSAAFIGTTLQIEPLLHMDDEGRLASIGKIRGRKKALKTLANNIEGNIKGLELSTVFISHSDCEEEAVFVSELIKEKYGVKEIMILDIGPTIGAHIGSGTVVVSYLGNKR